MAKELDAKLDHGEAVRSDSCLTENDSVSFLERIICPIYETLSAVSRSYYNFLCILILFFGKVAFHLTV